MNLSSRDHFFVAAAALTIAAFAGCSSQKDDCVAFPANALETLPPKLAYPADGATAVPANIGSLIVYSYGLGVTASALPLRLQAATKNIPVSPEPLPSPLPSPLASAPVPNPMLEAFAVPALSAQTAYALQVKSTGYTGNCPPVLTTQYSTIGSFTTQ